MTCHTPTHSLIKRPLPATFALPRLGRLLAAVAAWRAARRGRKAVARLAAFDDRMLADIGLHRSDVDAALAAPWNTDPTAVLATRRGRHRRRANFIRC